MAYDAGTDGTDATDGNDLKTMVGLFKINDQLEEQIKENKSRMENKFIAYNFLFKKVGIPEKAVKNMAD